MDERICSRCNLPIPESESAGKWSKHGRPYCYPCVAFERMEESTFEQLQNIRFNQYVIMTMLVAGFSFVVRVLLWPL